MSRIYKVVIIFENEVQENEILYEGISEMEYNIKDNLSISMSKIELICKRCKDKPLDKIITDFKSTINKQITRALSFLIATKGYMPNIKEINIIKFDKNNNYLDKHNTSDVFQPIIGKLPDGLKFNSDDLGVLFQDSKKSEAVLISLSYWIKGITSLNEGDKFNKLWTSFNSIYSFISNEKSEIKKLTQIRNFILNNQEKFELSCGIFDEYTQEDIRKLQWRNLILNDHKEESNTIAFHGFITRYYDYRINKVFQETICYRKDYLNNKNLLGSANSHINLCIAECKKNNAEVLALYILKYAYFIRNKSFHGEKIDIAFHIVKSDEVKELDLLNNILTIFLRELISINSNY